ncbi:MAG: Arginase [uncultured Thermomicrobiales bacterium]|uniref:Arginase n=1 Tax=uncultured Thermomicrobiales bacterium TaxID=1645740 RepID=A0A6J4VJ41_9BACT|nr:MAG: Arginase [uncultured Thermomicrobiales bacterium]
MIGEIEAATATGARVEWGGGSRLAEGPVRPIAMPLWLGAERRGAEMGPRLLDDGLRDRWDGSGDEDLARRLAPTVTVPVEVPADAADRLHRRSLEFLGPVAAACDRLAAEVASAVEEGALALVLGGDHALAAGSIAGAAMAARGRLGVLWFDTHPDLNTPATSPSGHIHGMSLAAALGTGVPALVDLGRPGPKVEAADVCLLGVRDIDPGEADLIGERGIWHLTAAAWSERGIVEGLDDALAHLAARGVEAVHVSFDLDVLDPAVLPGTGTAVPGGLTLREAGRVLRRLAAWEGPIRSVDWVELNPELDPGGRSAETAVALLATVLGEPGADVD